MDSASILCAGFRRSREFVFECVRSYIWIPLSTLGKCGNYRRKKYDGFFGCKRRNSCVFHGLRIGIRLNLEGFLAEKVESPSFIKNPG